MLVARAGRTIVVVTREEPPLIYPQLTVKEIRLFNACMGYEIFMVA